MNKMEMGCLSLRLCTTMFGNQFQIIDEKKSTFCCNGAQNRLFWPGGLCTSVVRARLEQFVTAANREEP